MTVGMAGLFLALFFMSPVDAAVPKSGVSGQSQPSKIVAVVNADPITRNELAAEAIARVGHEVLEDLINRHLILNECNQRGIAVTKEEVNAEVGRMAAKFGFNMEQYLGLLQEERGISPARYASEIVWPMLALRRLAADKVTVTQDEFNEAFQARYGEAIKCRLIMVEERTKCEKIHGLAAADPASFGALAKKYSEDETSASVGGLIPPIRRFAGNKDLEEAVFKLSDGEVSPMMALGDQWVILQAVRRIPATRPSDQDRELIKKQIADSIRDSKLREYSGTIFKELQQSTGTVTVLGDKELTKQYPGIAAIVGESRVTLADLAERCIKKDGLSVLEGMISRKLLAQAMRSSKVSLTQAELDAEIRDAAIRYNFVNPDGSPDMQRWMDEMTENGRYSKDVYIADAVWPSAALKAIVKDQIEITPEDIKKGFQSNYGPRADVLAIVLSDQRSAQKVWKLARDGGTEEVFGELAEKYSIEPISASNRGQVPPVQQFGGQPQVEKEVFNLKPGEMSGIVATGGKYMILRLQRFTEPVVTDINDVREELMRDLRDRAMRTAMAQKMGLIRKSAEVDNFLELELQEKSGS